MTNALSGKSDCIRESGPIMQLCECDRLVAMTPYIETSEGVAYICGECGRKRFRTWATIMGHLHVHIHGVGA
jgi:hypothetical protein